MADWDGKERRSVNWETLNSNLIELTMKIQTMSIRFDDELGNGGHQGSVKRHIRQMGDNLANLNTIIMGDGLTNTGLVHKIDKIENLNKRLLDHEKLDDGRFRNITWTMYFIICIGGIQILAILKLISLWAGTSS